MSLRVVFRRWRDSGEVIALFPDSEWDWRGNVASYQHIGQHGGADYSGVVSRSTLATPEQYADLLAELVSIGYDDLRVVKRA